MNATMMRALLWSGIPYNVTEKLPETNNSTQHRCDRPIPGYLIDHEATGYVAEVGEGVNFLSVGDYVVIPDRIDDGHLIMDPETYTAYGQPGLPGSQSEYVRVPYADHGLVPIPSSNGTESLVDYLFLSDIFPTAWTALDYAGFQPGDMVAIFGENAVLQNMINVTSINGGLGVAGVYHVYMPEAYDLPISIGALWAKALTLASGAVNPMIELPNLAGMITSGKARPSFIISSNISIEDAPEYYARFGQHREAKVVTRFP
ncbi:uncharacterized protein PAC_16159 [Phialocephala subalpina]|uniref:Alcohol dehydrogenase-like N-terminal domain-containing protein n=1 Tax=Phialocephala subalpina TaxID=576137 RepID=A0A1L7XML1_9HELO|nr:uncharacterized protein PAC_16159 [Phialocephala subalpina]